MLCNVRDYGAAGDGKTPDTAAIQKTIDACAAKGGGTVVFEAGMYLTGTIFLRNHVTLQLASAALLRGSSDISDYPIDKKCRYAHKLTERALIAADDCEHVGITGCGTIHGSGKAFSDSRPTLIRIRGCRHVILRDVLLRDYASWGVYAILSRDVRIEDVNIDSFVRKNNDGFDIDSCEDVFISNCHVFSGDDSIALKTSEPGCPCRNIVITNCVLSSVCAAIRIGPESKADFERIAVTNCVIHDTGRDGIKLQECNGTVMQDLTFSNIVMDNVVGPISVRLGGWHTMPDKSLDIPSDEGWENGRLRNVLFDNIRARVSAVFMQGTPYEAPQAEALKRQCITIMGTPRTKIEGITFSNVRMTFPGGGTAEEAARREIPELERQYPCTGMFGILPAYGMFVRHAEGITLNNVHFQLESPDHRAAVVCDDVEDLELNGFKAEAHATVALVQLRNTRRAFIAASRRAGTVGSFLEVDGASQQVLLDGTDMCRTEARKD